MRIPIALCISVAALCACSSSDDDGIVVADKSPNIELSQRDRTFIRQASLAGLYEVESSQWALDQDLDTNTRDVARTLVQDHKAANAELKSLAAARGIDVPDTLDAKHEELLQDLKRTSRGDSDHAFIEQQIQAHRDAIALYQDAARTATDVELRAFARKQLPVLREHLSDLQNLD